jgi:hypothetical protein
LSCHVFYSRVSTSITGQVIEERNLRLEAEQVVQSYLILEQEKRGLESDLLKERNHGLEAESMVIEKRNQRLEESRWSLREEI